MHDVMTGMDEQEARRLVAEANLPALLVALWHQTGDEWWLSERFRASRTVGLGDNPTGGLAPEVQDEIREAAAQVLAAGLREPAEPPAPEELTRALAFAMGEPIPEEQAPLIERSVLGGDPWSRDDAPRLDGIEVVVVGAGMSGVAAAIRLSRLGASVQVLEAGHDVGGTWRDNRYPGVGVDTPSHLYAYSFAPADWTRFFPLGDEIVGYFRDTARAHGVYGMTRFDTAVTRVVHDDATGRWSVEAAGPGGPVHLECDVVISAVGLFNPPRIPELPGMDAYWGRTLHTAQWPEDLDLRGSRVAVVGNGASAMQVVPRIAEQAEHVHVFQRSPHWIAPFEQFEQPIPAAARELLACWPLYRRWYRMRLMWTFNDKNHDALIRDPSWTAPERAMNARNDGHRVYFERYIERKLGDRPDLMAKVTPDYPPFAKRMLLDNGWYDTLRRPNVTLVDEAVEALEPGGVRSRSGSVDADTVVFATGFGVEAFVSTFECVGPGGVTLRRRLDETDGHAYLGTLVAGFPNLFVLYGPNLQAGHGGSLTFSVEYQLDLVTNLLAEMRARDTRSVAVRPEVSDRYNAEVDRRHADMVWTHPRVSTYYRSRRGRVTINTPFRNLDMWHMAQAVDAADYEFADGS